MAPRRLYVPLAVDYFRDPALVRARMIDARTETLWTRLLAVAKDVETDGVLRAEHLELTGVAQWRKLVGLLVDVELLIANEDGSWTVASWAKFNMSCEQIAAARQRKADNVAAYRQRMAEERARTVTGDVTGNATGNEPVNPSVTSKHKAQSTKLEAGRHPSDVLPGATKTPKQRRRDPLLDSLALVDAPGADLAEVTNWSKYARFRSQLPEGTTADEITARAAEYRRKHPTWDCTAGAVVNRWHELAPRSNVTAMKPRGQWLDGGDPARVPTDADIDAGRYERWASF